MGIEFHVDFDPCEGAIREVSASMPANPFCTVEYCAARRTMGLKPVILSLRDRGRTVTACLALIRRGRISGSLEIDSLPNIPDGPEFWDGLTALCRAEKMSGIIIYGYSSEYASIPALRGEVSRKMLREFVLPLGVDSLWTPMRKGHRWSINRARKSGLEIRRSRDPRDCDGHVSMMLASMDRRRARGEVVPDGAPLRECTALVRSGAGELYQAILGGRVLSSALVLLAEQGAYYHTAGTSPEGMERGASHLLIHEVAVGLKERGGRAFNLGGVSPGDSHGLGEFKAGFGAEAVAVESAEFSTSTWIRKEVGKVVKVLRSGFSRTSGLVRARSAEGVR
jgi:hypothetical protein